MSIIRRLATAGCTAFITYACTAPAPVSYLTLNAPPQDSLRHSARAVAVGPVTLPDYLKRSGLARRGETGALQYSNTQLWAEPLDRGIQRTLVDTLSAALEGTLVTPFPSPSSHDARHGISVNVHRLEASGDSVVMQAKWTILAAPTPTAAAIRTGSFDRKRTLTTADGPAIASAISELVHAMALEIAAAVPAREN